MAYIQPESHIPKELRLTLKERQDWANSFPLHAHDSDARCFKCGGSLTNHRDYMFCKHRTGHRVGDCPACGLVTLYDLVVHPIGIPVGFRTDYTVITR